MRASLLKILFFRGVGEGGPRRCILPLDLVLSRSMILPMQWSNLFEKGDLISSGGTMKNPVFTK